MYGDDFGFENDLIQVVHNKARGVSALGRALPGLCLSSTCAKSYCIHQDPSIAFTAKGLDAFDQPNQQQQQQDLLNYDLDWPEWSRWVNPRTRWSVGSLSEASSAIDKTYSVASTSEDLSTGAYSNDFSNSFGSESSVSSFNVDFDSYEGKKEKHSPSSAGPIECKNETRSVSCSINNCLHPAKSGHTLWVGNLPHSATLQDLCDVFGTPSLQSVYLIQRTGCAFINYSSSQGLEEGLQVVEVRGPKIRENSIVVRKQNNSSSSNSSSSGSTTSSQADSSTQEDFNAVSSTSAAGSKNRYFICKSLTVADLEEAKRTGLWSTQIRNLQKFNDSFESSENTYLVFSVNRMSCFYGVARLESKFEESNSASSDLAVKDDKSIMALVTPTKEYLHSKDNILIPAGKTVFDPLRGSQFWMAHDCPAEEAEVDKFTVPAKIHWITSSDSTVSFSKTKSWKNRLNQNKPLKVARDGTEIEPTVAKELCALFKTN